MAELRIEVHRTNSRNREFIGLVEELDSYLKTVDGDDHEFYNQYNSIDLIRHVIVAYVNNKAIGCGAIKQLDSNTMEVKRMLSYSPET